MIEAIIFDMDGILIDSEGCWDKARSLMAADVGVAWNSDDHKAVMGVSTHEWVSYMTKRLSLDLSPVEVEEAIVSTMRNIYSEKIPFLPGAEAAVAFASNTLPTGLASGSPRSLIDTVTSYPTLRGKFQVILSGDEVPHGKPSPDIYLTAAEKLGVPPHNCVCLEDSGNGILAGKNAGMKVIAIPDERFMPSSEQLQIADIRLSSLKELTKETLAKLQ